MPRLLRRVTPMPRVPNRRRIERFGCAANDRTRDRGITSDDVGMSR